MAKTRTDWGDHPPSDRDKQVRGRVQSRYSITIRGGEPVKSGYQFRGKCPVCGKMVTGPEASDYRVADMKFLLKLNAHTDSHSKKRK